MSTSYHAKYFAHELTRKSGEGIERLSRSLFDASVDLNPHQIEAAMFALRSPVSKGVLLADEVGLGKTIEAGLVACQSWAERKRRVLVICPASLRKQWALELEEKFNLPTFVLDAKIYRQSQKSGNPDPFTMDAVVICSMHFASQRSREIRPVPWDLTIIDEAHKLRNVYRQSNRIGQNIKWALEDRKKILLTATPLQNSLLELFGLSTIIDDRIFGDLPSFRTQYVNVGGNLEGLRERLRVFCNRTLRRQVLEYIQFTERKLITRPFLPSEQEHKLYEAISDFLQRDDTYALPRQQRHLTTLIVRKLLASSSQALAGTLEVMRNRLITMRDKEQAEADMAEKIIEEEDMEEEILEEILDGEEESAPDKDMDGKETLKFDRKKLDDEIDELNRYIQWARGIGVDTKSRALLKALKIGFEKLKEMNANSKAVIFTESRRTQIFLRDFLETNGYADGMVTFNGSNKEPESTKIHEDWLRANEGTGRASGSRPVDMRTAIIENFRDKAQILIATEAAAEGINLQFCSLVVNFDLPWNPQRIEQRIGRCHRYGQKHDVVVINFLNQRNEADRRVYELLEEKFNLFSGVFGASDEVLGSLESGVDFERRVLEIYQQCRTQEEIETAFKALRADLDESISSRIQDTREMLLEHFDEDVHSRLKVNLSGAREQLDRFGRMFWKLTNFILDGKARQFDDQTLTFELLESPIDAVRRGKYHLISKDRENIPGEFLYRLSHPLGEYVIQSGMDSPTPVRKVSFDITNNPTKISLVENLKNRSGWLILQRLVIDSFDREEYLLFSGFQEGGENLDQETCEKLFNCQGTVNDELPIPKDVKVKLDAGADRHAKATISKRLEKNSGYFNEAREQLEKWAEDMALAAEKELKDAKEQIKAMNRQARQAATIEEQHQCQEKIRQLEKSKRRQRQKIFDVEDEIMEKRDKLIDALEKRMKQKTKAEELFTIYWTVQ